MNKPRISIGALVVMAVSIICSPTAFAGHVNFRGMGLNKQLHLAAPQYLGYNSLLSIGQLKIEYDGTKYDAFCVDLGHNAGGGKMSERTVGSSGINNAREVAFLVEHFAQTVGRSATRAAALQAAIWEVIYETAATWDVTWYNGNTGFGMWGNQRVASKANHMLNYVKTNMPDDYAPGNSIIVLSDAGTNCGIRQSLIIEGPVVTPEPATMTLLALGSLSMLRRRRSRTA